MAHTVLLGLALLATACGGGTGDIDWSAPENFVLRETSAPKGNGVELEYWSLVDVPCLQVWAAIADIEHYPDFVPGVEQVQLVETSGNKKTAEIAQRVIGRQSNAKVEWTFKNDDRRIEFTTLSSDLTYNDGHHVVEPSPDRKRCLVKSTFLVKEGQGQAQSPAGALASGTRDAFIAAAQGVKKRAVAGVPPSG